MKAQCKYSFRAGLPVRGAAFGVIVVMELLFGLFSTTVTPWEALKITAVSLGGTAIAVMMAMNIIGDVAIARRLFTSPDAYLHALTPAPRWKTLLSSLIAMTVMDFVTMAVVIMGEVWLSFILAGSSFSAEFGSVLTKIFSDGSSVWTVVWGFLSLLLGYLLIMLIILFGVTAKKSFLYKLPAAGLLTFLLICGCVYAISLLTLLLTPFGSLEQHGLFFILTLGRTSALPFALLTLLETAGLFCLTARLLERKVNL